VVVSNGGGRFTFGHTIYGDILFILFTILYNNIIK
jgi:hypothetical protein